MNIRVNKRDFVAEPKEIEGIVKKFSDELTKELGPLVRSVVMFGSSLKHDFVSGKKSLRDETLFGSDIDVLVVFDDLIDVLTPEVVTAYRIVTEKTASRISKRMHITTMPLTKFWDYSIKGDPILINMLREGKAVFDTGCFGISQKLLGSRKIKPEKEIVWIYLARGPMSVSNAKWNIKQAVLSLYWAVIDAAHSALLHHDIVPETPEHLLPLFRHHLVDNGLLNKRYLSVLAEFMNVGKMIMSNELHRMSGDNYDRYRKEAEDFIHAVRELISQK